MIKQVKAKLVILTNNCPALRKSDIEILPCWLKLVLITTVAIIMDWAQHVENTAEYACTLAIVDPGDSDVIRSMPEQIGEK